MFDAVGYKVSRLMRVRFGVVSLPFGLRRGGWRELEEDQTSRILEWSETLVHPELAEAAEPPAVRPAAQRTPGKPVQSHPSANRPGKDPGKGPGKGPGKSPEKSPGKSPEKSPGKGRPAAGKGRFSPVVGRAREEKPDRRPRSSRAR
jgi:23S rRNA pseudouridine2605 synthase